jgi:hypothetical protein
MKDIKPLPWKEESLQNNMRNDQSFHEQKWLFALLISGLLAFVWNPGMAVGENPPQNSEMVTKASYTSVSLPAGKVEYRYGFEQNAKMLDIQGTIINKAIQDATIAYTITPLSEKGWLVDITFSGVPETSMFFFTSKMDEKGSVETDEQHSGDSVETTSIRREKVEYVGLSKIIEWEKSQGRQGKKRGVKPKECMISPDEIVTTFLQLPIWAGTVRNIPGQVGVGFRWCLQGDPIPMQMFHESSSDPKVVIYSCHKISYTDPLKGDKAIPTLVRMTFDKEQYDKGFAMPTTITIQAGRISLSVVSKNSP